MPIFYRGWLIILGIFLWSIPIKKSVAQDTQILGFVAGETSYQDEQLNFGIGEQDLFIRSQLNDNFSFIGETVFKFSANSATDFNASVERIIIAYNYKGNHSILFGKHHTPVNYWNNSFHHARVFFPTIARPILFGVDFVPLHTTGISFQGLNLGPLRFGYNLMIGNGLGATDVADNNEAKSITAALTINPLNDWHFGASIYRDVVSAGSNVTGSIIPSKTTQHLITATVANFSSKFELLAESTLALNDVTGFGQTNSFATYVYAGLHLNDKIVPYVRFDNLEYDSDEQFFDNEDTNSFIAGLRHEISYLIVVKLEYQHIDREFSGKADMLNAQIAIGF